MKKPYKISEEKIKSEHLEDIQKILLRCWTRLHPEIEFVMIALPKDDPEQRKKILRQVTEIFTSDAYADYCRNEKQDR